MRATSVGVFAIVALIVCSVEAAVLPATDAAVERSRPFGELRFGTSSSSSSSFISDHSNAAHKRNDTRD